MTPALLAGFTGVIQGARHALEPDHVTAVANVMVASPSSRRGIFYAGCWGLGHSAMLIGVAGPLVLLGVRLPESFSTALELAVGAMLVYLGVRTLRQARSAASAQAHGHSHTLPLHVRGRQPFAIGLVHGLAGSGALAALVAISSPDAATALACLVLYALGTVLGMVALAAAVGPVLARAGRAKAVGAVLARASGAVSLAVGAVWIFLTLDAL